MVTDGRIPLAYDFLRPVKLAREHLRTLNVVSETFAHRLAVLLTYNLRVVCRVTPYAVQHSSIEEHVAWISEPTVIAPLSLEPLPGTALLEISRNTAMVCVDHLLGGRGGDDQPQRPLSEIETPLFRDLITEILAELRDSFAGIEDIYPSFGALEYDPQLVQFGGGPTDSMLVASFELAVGEVTSVLSLCLPLQGLMPALQRYHDQAAVSASERAARQAAHELLSDRLQEVPIEVNVRFDSVKMQSTQLLGLHPGDVVPLGHPVDRPLEITADGQIFGHAVATKRGKRLACQIVNIVQEEHRA
ncbi:MAG TPA: flagellar motor switch protein FliM [Actinophytocola sp.]|uniref:flagellar motor switch protein FliM n=1 Tax=Actinophytocola sp. TaxID=1872138 RepID=UPI002DB69BAA|nr:flagellar motor switch protein FliM [Actinophytocola sp.]HEU5474224.1 flagellar motor switch protein FliM [Actinophytocola sp.]